MIGFFFMLMGGIFFNRFKNFFGMGWWILGGGLEKSEVFLMKLFGVLDGCCVFLLLVNGNDVIKELWDVVR